MELKYKKNKWNVDMIEVPEEWVLETRGNRDGMYFEVHRVTPSEYMVFVDFHPCTPKAKSSFGVGSSIGSSLKGRTKASLLCLLGMPLGSLLNNFVDFWFRMVYSVSVIDANPNQGD
jgi:hypothetical protein